MGDQTTVKLDVSKFHLDIYYNFREDSEDCKETESSVVVEF